MFPVALQKKTFSSAFLQEGITSSLVITNTMIKLPDQFSCGSQDAAQEIAGENKRIYKNQYMIHK